MQAHRGDKGQHKPSQERRMAQYGVYTATGRKRRTIYGKTRTEVARKLAKAISNRDNGFTFDSQNLTVGDYLDSWLKNSVHDTVRVTTYQGYERIVRLHIKPTLEGIKLDRLTPSNRVFPRPAAYLRHPPIEQGHARQTGARTPGSLHYSRHPGHLQPRAAQHGRRPGGYDGRRSGLTGCSAVAVNEEL
jgi:hypothetical protein